MADSALSKPSPAPSGPDGPAPTNRTLLWAALGDFAVAAALAVTCFVGESAYSFFGVEFLAEMAAAGSMIPPVVSGGLAICGGLAGVWALSGGGYLPRLPFLGIILTLVTAAFLVRGAWLAIELARVIPDSQSVRFRELLLSAGALGIGFLHLGGLRDLVSRPQGRR